MEQSIRTLQSSKDRSVVLEKLKKEQQSFSEGSFEWADIQAKIDRIAAQNFLEYVNS